MLTSTAAAELAKTHSPSLANPALGYLHSIRERQRRGQACKSRDCSVPLAFKEVREGVRLPPCGPA